MIGVVFLFFNNFAKGKSVFMIGIGGISMSGLAEILNQWGYRVSGSDMASSHITDKLIKSGISVAIPHNAENVYGTDVVIYTAAVKTDNPEYMKAVQLNIPLIDRASLLGEITAMYSNAIAISGTHGKTTTTSMTALALHRANADPTVLVGGELGAIGGNYCIGNSGFLVTEACEYVESFLKFSPHTSVILNIEADHLDYFRDIEHIKSSFLKFGNKTRPEGTVIGNLDDANIIEIFRDIERNKISFAINNSQADFVAKNITFNPNGCAQFTVSKQGETLGFITLKIPGIHNVYNALACISVCSSYGIDFDKMKIGIEEFEGAKRRFELIGETNGIKIYDDYAHHPSEVIATLDAASKKSHKSLWCIFQPHTYTRTKSLLHEFSSSFKNATKVIVLDIYAARETNTCEIHSKDLVNEINKVSENAIYAENFEKATQIIEENVSPGDIVMTMGAGNVYQIGKTLLNKKAPRV